MTRDHRYCTTECQRIDWRDRGHRKACKTIRNERAAEAARAEAPTLPPSPPKEIFYGPAPRSHADEIRARIAAEHEAARARREANPEPEPTSARFGGRCPICLEAWDVNQQTRLQSCCCRWICMPCFRKTYGEHGGSCPICAAPPPTSEAGYLAELRRHVEREVPEAINALGEIYREGRLVVKSTKKAAKIFKRGMALGNVDAMTNLGNLYERGDGVKLDKEKAMQLYRMAADRGDADAQNSLGIMLEHHSGDMEDAVRYYKLAAAQGLHDGLYDLGVCFERGYGGLGVSFAEAKRLYQMAADGGHVRSRANLAGLLAHEGDTATALRLWQLCAEQGDVNSELNIGMCYERGVAGVSQNKEEARRRYARAAARGLECPASAASAARKLKRMDEEQAGLRAPRAPLAPGERLPIEHI